MSVTLDTMTDEQKRFSMYYIALCENGGSVSSAKWAADNYGANEAITLGILQWYGAAAGEYLAVMQASYPDLYAAMPQRWQETLTSGGSWTSIWITAEEHETYQAAVQAHLEDSKDSQYACWFSSTFNEGLKKELDGISYITDWCDDIKVVFYYMNLYHLSPKLAQQVHSSIGQVTDLDTIAQAACGVARSLFPSQWADLGTGWTNRFLHYALDPLKSWDGSSNPPDEWGSADVQGQPSASGVDNVGGGSSNPAYRIRYVFNQTGGLLFVFMQDGSCITCVKSSSGQVWRPISLGTAATGSTGQQSAGGGGGSSVPSGSTLPTTGWSHMQEAYDALQAIGEGAWTYSMDYHAYDPWVYHKTDCSGFVSYVYKHFDEATAANVWGGSYPPATPGLYQNCHVVTSGTRSGYSSSALDQMLPGDMFMVSDTSNFGSGGGSHVMMYCGNNISVEMSYSNNGPHFSTASERYGYLANYYPYWCIIRPQYA